MSIDIPVIFEDEVIVVVNKPPGVVVNRAESVKGETVQDWMERRYPEAFEGLNLDNDLEQLFTARSGVVHRLDKDTSGVMVLSKTPKALMALMSQFKERTTEKIYVALVHGRPNPEKGNLRVPLGRIPRNRKKFGVVIGGKMTETSYETLESYGSKNKSYEDGFSLVELFPKTGRTHQLRVVLAHLGHAIVGDGAYVGRKRSKKDAKWCPRQFLHAKRLKISQPETGEKIEFEADLPSDLAMVLEKVKAGGDGV